LRGQEKFRGFPESLAIQAALQFVLLVRMKQQTEKQLSDADLLHLVACGDRDACGALYDRYARRILGVLTSMVDSRTEAEDVLQETFVQILSSARGYDACRGPVVVWMMQIARSRAIDMIRRRNRRRVIGNQQRPDGRDPAETADLKDRVQATGLALTALSPDERDAILLAFMGGLTHEGVAESLGVPLGTVKSRIRSGVRKLRQSLNH
jgi:RNA polymerase sigma-70 factor (ECF subfamily)